MQKSGPSYLKAGHQEDLKMTSLQFTELAAKCNELEVRSSLINNSGSCILCALHRILLSMVFTGTHPRSACIIMQLGELKK
jgi:hypothetical protein